MALPILAHWAGRSIFDIEPAALARRGIRLLLADLDNTLAPYGEPEPTQAVRDWAAALGEQGITLFVLSNNRHPERPRRFSQALGVPFLGHAGKPKPGGFRRAMALSLGFACLLSAAVAGFAEPLMGLFLQPEETAVLAAGVRYLRIEGAFYPGIACLFLLYGIYRAVRRSGMSVVLTVLSLGTRVALAYALAGPVGESGIWWAIPIGWGLADLAGFLWYRFGVLRRGI